MLCHQRLRIHICGGLRSKDELLCAGRDCVVTLKVRAVLGEAAGFVVVVHGTFPGHSQFTFIGPRGPVVVAIERTPTEFVKHQGIVSIGGNFHGATLAVFDLVVEMPMPVAISEFLF